MTGMTKRIVPAAALLAFAPFLSFALPPAPAAAQQCAVDLNGDWIGQSSGNRVTIEMRAGGILVYAPGTRNPGQAAGQDLWGQTGADSWAWTFPGGEKAVAQIESDGLLKVTQPGWNDRFRRVVPAPPCGQAPSVASATPPSAFSAQPNSQPMSAPAVPPRQPNGRAPQVVTVARLGNGCVTASLRNAGVRNADYAQGDWVLSNGCARAQVVIADIRAGLGYRSWPGALNAGDWASTANADVPAGLTFSPVMSSSEQPRYVIPAMAEHVRHDDMIPLVSPQDPSLQVYVASCDAVSQGGFEQVIFRESPQMVSNTPVACGPSRLRSQRPEATQYAYEQANAQGHANFNRTQADLQRYKADVERYEADVRQYESDVGQYELDVAAQQAEVAKHNAAQAEYLRKQAEYEAELERARKARADYEAAIAGSGD